MKYFSANGGAGGDSPSKKRRGQESQYPAPNTPVTSPNHNLGPAAAAPFSVISPSRIPTIHNKKSSLDSSSHVGGLSERPRKNSLDNELSSGLVTITQFYSVNFSQSRIGVKSAFSTNAQSRFASVVVDSVPGPPCLARHT